MIRILRSIKLPGLFRDFSSAKITRIPTNPKAVCTQPRANENYFIYKYIHKRVEEWGKRISSLSDDVSKLRKLAEHDRDLSKELFDRIAKNIQNCDTLDLVATLDLIKSDKQREFRQLRMEIDRELRNSLKKQSQLRRDTDIYFYASDMFHISQTKSTFVDYFLDHLNRTKLDNLTDKQLLHALFLVILQRQDKGSLLIKAQTRLLRMVESAKFEEIVIIALAYFKTKTKIENPQLFTKIVNRTLKLMPEIDLKEPGYCAIVKSIRYSSLLSCRDEVEGFISKLPRDFFSKIILSSPYNAVHTVKLMETYRIYNSHLLDELMSSMFSKEFRIKDVQYALTSLSNFSYNDLKVTGILRYNLDKLCQMIASESRKDAHMQYFHIMPMLRALTIFGYYNPILFNYINNLLKSPTRLAEMIGSLEFERTALLVYVASRLETSDCHLGEDVNLFRTWSSKMDRTKQPWIIDSDSVEFKRNSKVMGEKSLTFLMENLGKELATRKELTCCTLGFQYTLPHQNYLDLVISDGPLPGGFYRSTLMPRAIAKGKKHCLIYGLTKFDYVDGQSRLSGYKRLFIRLLERIGYRVVCVDLNDPDVEMVAKKINRLLANK